MTELLWILTCLPLALTAVSTLPAPINVKVTVDQLGYVLRWEPGVGTPNGTSFNVYTYRWVSPGGVFEWKPLQAAVENSADDSVFVLRDSHPERKPEDFEEFHFRNRLTGKGEAEGGRHAANVIGSGNRTRDGRVEDSRPPNIYVFFSAAVLGPPEFSVSGCGNCLVLQVRDGPGTPSYHNEELKDLHKEMELNVRRTRDGAEVFWARPTGRRPPGKTQDTLEGLCLSAGLGTPWDSSGGAGGSDWGEGSLGFPSEAATPATRGRRWMDGWMDAVISAVLSLLVMGIIAVFALLFWTGFICLKRRPMPSVLTSISHLEEVKVSSCGDAPSSLLNVRSMAPPGAKRTSSSSEESDEESCTENSGLSSSGANYALHQGANPLSSTSSSSSSLSSASKPKPPPNRTPDSQHEVLVVIEPRPGAEQKLDSLEKRITEEEEAAVNVGQEVNLLTLTFGWPEEEEEEEEKADEEEGCPDVPDELRALAAPLVHPPQPADDAAATYCTDEDEAYDDCDYMCRQAM
ncbi:hypothetical protein CCH79_00013724 [Gambusia affinis]|uniref:Fibronectin type-III domain-containing protein n=1 Tax=Gambusia affinis TaxID=33528 RepID=A0A315VRR5_GAMAF|nr:hypothetical protein CCH79_00013724 [Gambusia affinis]